MIEFDNVMRSYAQKVAVDHLSLTVAGGELFALLGPNGAGKTTTIKMLTGLLRPTGGSVRVCGHDVVADVRRAARSIGYVPEEPFLYDKLSGREFLEFVAEMRGLRRPDIDQRIRRECQFFDLGDFLDDLIETYSHGMRQRLVFASALLHDPPVLVIDEPMVGLDPRERAGGQGPPPRRAAAGRHRLHVHPHPGRRRGDRRPHRHHGLRPARISWGPSPTCRSHLASHDASLERLFLELTSGRRKGGRRRAEGGGMKAEGWALQAQNDRRPKARQKTVEGDRGKQQSPVVRFGPDLAVSPTALRPPPSARFPLARGRGAGVRADAPPIIVAVAAADVRPFTLSRLADRRADQRCSGVGCSGCSTTVFPFLQSAFVYPETYADGRRRPVRRFLLRR